MSTVFFGKLKLSRVFISEGRWKASPMNNVAAPPGFRTRAKRRVEVERAEEDPS